MIYLQKNKKRSKKKIIIISLLVIFILLNFFRINFVQNVTYRVIEPLVFITSKIPNPFSGIRTTFIDKDKIIKENEDLKNEITQTRIDLLSLKLLEGENRELRGIKEDGKGGVISRIITRPPDSPYDTFIIDIGFNENVSVSNEVYAYGILIGEIVQVHDRTSLVKLHSSPDSEISIRINGDIEALGQGQGGGRFISTIPKDVSVNEGDSISFPEETKAFSLIHKVISTDTDSFQTIFFNSPFNISEISFVEVILE